MQQFFQSLFAKVQAWLNSKGGFSHVVAVLFVGAMTAYAAVPAFQKLVQDIYAALPAQAEEVALAIVGLYAWYHHASSPAGTLARARQINANGNAPTAAQVDAADVKIQ